MSEKVESAQRSVELTRTSTAVYTVRNATGAEMQFGHGDGLFSPVELLLAAIAGCSSIDVDTVTARSAEPTSYTVTATGDKLSEDGATRVDNLNIAFNIEFPDTEGGQKAAGMVERLAKLSHDKYCTVSRTVERGTPVSHTLNVTVGDSTD
ncbi:putative OsmC-like protein [Arthrobacter stackebrandtii]|uniref:OsmC-like protein n=1 Tax=Arthrobacter stackebrandtii TaxID=272161 RepID=A0ABS4YWA8_9MICC|nr:OsmC family protein [Arthrobacter stackebrandtii]MBP2413046.1 putative OsmC-like protein [Arthrobacter stackebrandtii]PYH01176.1 oxidoreductase [Arthrobacter stackebrandtii]